MPEKKCKCAAVVALAALAAARAAWAGIAFDGPGSRVQLTHDADESNPLDVPFTTGRITVPTVANLYPTNPYLIDHTFTSGSANTWAVGSLARVTNATTASFVLATGTGVTQTDPINAYPGKSSLRFDVDLNWNVTAGGFGPLANGYASLNTGVVVGAGGSAELVINLNFLNQDDKPLRSAWSTSRLYTVAGTYNDVFSTSRVMGTGVLPAGSQLHILGSVEFKASNADSPSRFDAPRMEAGGAPPTAKMITDAQGIWFDRGIWEFQNPNPNEPGLIVLPNSIGHRATIMGTDAISTHQVSITDNITLGTLDITSPTPYNFTGNAPISWNTQQGEAVLDIRSATGGHSFQNPMVLTSMLDAIVEGNSLLTLAGNISGAQGLTKLGAGTLTLTGNNTYGGNTLIAEG